MPEVEVQGKKVPFFSNEEKKATPEEAERMRFEEGQQRKVAEEAEFRKRHPKYSAFKDKMARARQYSAEAARRAGAGAKNVAYGYGRLAKKEVGARMSQYERDRLRRLAAARKSQGSFGPRERLLRNIQREQADNVFGLNLDILPSHESSKRTNDRTFGVANILGDHSYGGDSGGGIWNAPDILSGSSENGKRRKIGWF